MNNLDVNPTAPVTSFLDLVALAISNCAPGTSDSGYLWDAFNVEQAQRNSKDCLQVTMRRSDNAASAYRWLYYNKVLIGYLDYPQLLSFNYLPWTAIPSTRAANIISGLYAWVSNVCQLFAFPYTGCAIVAPFHTNSWQFSASLVPNPPYNTNPGVKTYEALWCQEYTDKTANVQSGPTATLDTTQVTPSYSIAGGGSATSFQQDFQGFATLLVSQLSTLAADMSPAAGFGVLDTDLQALTGKLTTLNKLLDPAGGDSASPNSVFSYLAALRSDLGELKTAVDAALACIAQSSDVQALTTALSGLKTDLDSKLDAVSSSVDGVKTQLYDTGASKSIAQKTGSLSATVDLTDVTTKLQAIVTAIAGSTSGASVVGAIADKAIPVADLSGLVTAVGSLSTALAGKLQAIADGLPNAATGSGSGGGTALSAIATTLTAIGTTLATIGTHVASVDTELGTPLGNVGTDLAGILTVLKQITGQETVNKTVSVDLGGAAATALGALKDAVISGLSPSGGAYLAQIRDSLGYDSTGAKNGLSDSIRTQVANLLGCLQLVSADGNTKTSLAEFISTLSMSVYWSDLLFQYGQ